MTQHHFLPHETLTRLEPADMGLVYTSVQRLELDGSIDIHSTAEESCAVVLAGSVAYACGGHSGSAVLCDMLYLPAGETLTLSAQGAVVMLYGAPCARATRFAHIPFAQVDGDARHKTYGTAEQSTRREVWNFIDESFDSSRFLMGICYGAPGGWTAWPPHEHGEKREEVYVYFDMGDGFGVQCVYNDMQRPDTMALVQNHHLVAIPGGYHPNVGCPKTGIRYVYCMVSVTPDDRNFMDLHTQAIYGDRLE